MARTRGLKFEETLEIISPRGVVVDTTIVLMFHPIFMTQVDKAYHIQCNYLETNEEVTQALDVR
ncbi:unnamed protein product [Strongylus vulgaris]|uniref:ZP domain-containing protein n=1 Tax=Strongylus vulgaris TaxID=40348 RepID=A0A3P7LHC9_STRVU|nr:unnamed protein product [Strongylus vulgaris]